MLNQNAVPSQQADANNRRPFIVCESLVKIFKISNTINDFMLFRNSMRLIFSRKANDLITIGFLSSGNDLLSPRLTAEQNAGTGNAHEIRAHVGAFNKISWHFQGEPVDVDTMVKHYVAEFLRQSAR